MAKKKQRKPAPNARDSHHLLFTRATWQGQWSKRLRNHPYCIVRLPRSKVHEAIHQHVSGIPVPPEWICESVLCQINEMAQVGLIGRKDNITQRLTVLIEEFGCFDDKTAEYAVQMLKWQRNVVHRSLRGEI